ncbi:unnamed protein product [Allacma fusca]|uniref:DM13 domain-containing protein n=1 Tax=Allacma fusca TaxID=39272 RepID=A0A8J2LIG2_9HEXA|nr:unnamed protein product [Allacma fusca]
MLVTTQLLMNVEAAELRAVGRLPGSNRRVKRQEDDDDQESDRKVVGSRNGTVANLGPVTIGSFRGYVHSVDSSDAIILDDKTLEIPDFSYDGEGPASWFVVGQDGDYTQEFVDLPDITVIPDENESCNGLKRYNGQTLRLTLPGKLKMSDISYVSLYCLRFNHNFGYLVIPDDLKLRKSPRDTSRLEECENVESSESGSGGTDNGGDRRPRPRPRPRPTEEPEKRPGLIGGLLNLLG